MAIFLGFLALLLLSFIGVQFNDPDGPLWMIIYLVPLVALIAAIFRASWYTLWAVKALAGVALAIFFVLVWHYWPDQEGFWQQEVWWEEETAREGMGMMIAWVCLIIGVVAGWRRGRIPHER